MTYSNHNDKPGIDKAIGIIFVLAAILVVTNILS